MISNRPRIPQNCNNDGLKWAWYNWKVTRQYFLMGPALLVEYYANDLQGPRIPRSCSANGLQWA